MRAAAAWAVTLLAGAMVLPATVLAEPAVSSPNGKISIEGGSISDNGAFLGLGSYTVPLNENYGLQFDGALGSVDSHVLGGGGVHLFARDPSRYLFGVYGSVHNWNDITIWRAAGEAELYRDRFSLSGLAGIEGINGSATDNAHFFGLFDVAYYPMDDLKLSAGFDYVNETGMGTAGVEYLMHHGTHADLPLRQGTLRRQRLSVDHRRCAHAFRRRSGGLAYCPQPHPRPG